MYNINNNLAVCSAQRIVRNDGHYKCKDGEWFLESRACVQLEQGTTEVPLDPGLIGRAVTVRVCCCRLSDG